MLPPFNGGLHCGASLGAAGPSTVPGAPAFQRRAPLRRLGRRWDGAGTAVLPPFNGGLHCGTGLPVTPVPAVGVLPPFNGGLHCGAMPASDCGRLRLGAPAFQRRAPLRRHGRGSRTADGCSRLSTAGSIAAADLPDLRRIRRGAPAFQRRAPLRHVDAAPGRRLDVQVLPPFNGGLHCGASMRGRTGQLDHACSRLSTAGSIAASRTRPAGRSDRRAPAFQRRAPLRRMARSAGRSCAGGCSRLSTAGSIAARGRSCRRPD